MLSNRTEKIDSIHTFYIIINFRQIILDTNHFIYLRRTRVSYTFVSNDIGTINSPGLRTPHRGFFVTDLGYSVVFGLSEPITGVNLICETIAFGETVFSVLGTRGLGGFSSAIRFVLHGRTGYVVYGCKTYDRSPQRSYRRQRRQSRRNAAGFIYIYPLVTRRPCVCYFGTRVCCGPIRSRGTAHDATGPPRSPVQSERMLRACVLFFYVFFTLFVVYLLVRETLPNPSGLSYCSNGFDFTF